MISYLASIISCYVDDRTAQAFRKILSENDDNEREIALRILGARGQDREIIIRQAIEDEDDDVAITAIEVLSDYGEGKRALKIAYERLEALDMSLSRERLANVMARIIVLGGFDEIKKGLTSRIAEVRAAVARAVGREGLGGLQDELRRLIMDEDFSVARAASRALCTLATENDIELIIARWVEGRGAGLVLVQALGDIDRALYCPFKWRYAES